MVDALAGLVLAGGKSRRMGGGDKFLMELEGQTLFDRAIGRLKPQVGEIAISANCDPALLAAYPYPVLPDPPPAGRGPLAGIMAGLDWAADRTGVRHLLTVASDTPFFPADFADALTRAAVDDREMIVLAASNGHIHPVFGLWPVSAREALRDWLDAGSSLKVTDFTDKRKHRIRDFSLGNEGDPFFNINTPADLTEAGRRMAGAIS